MLAWKMSLLAYCRGDGKAVDKFADLFRALRTFYPSPFPCGPPKGQAVEGSLTDAQMVDVLAANEAFLETDSEDSRVHSWWRAHDPLKRLEGARLPVPRLPR